MDLPHIHEHALSATGTVIEGISEGQLDLPTPCDGWSVRELLDHVIGGNWWAAELAAGKNIADVGDRLDGDQIGADLQASYRASARAAEAAFKAPGAMDAPCAVSYGPVPGSIYCGHRTLDIVIHGWDLAKATGQDTTIDPQLVDAIAAIVAPQMDMIVGSGMFGTTVVVANDADAQTRLLAQLGRHD